MKIIINAYNIVCMCGVAGMHYMIYTRGGVTVVTIYIIYYYCILSSSSSFQLSCTQERDRESALRIYVCACVRAHVTSWFIDTTMSMVIKVEKRGADVPRVRRQRRSCVSSSSSSSSSHYTRVCIHCAAAMMFKRFYITRQSTLLCAAAVMLATYRVQRITLSVYICVCDLSIEIIWHNIYV